MSELSLQEKYAPHNACFGCGPSNKKGLGIRSMVAGDEVVAEWRNWTAAWHLMVRNNEESPPCTVTADYSIKLLRPTPTDGVIKLRAWVESSKDDRAEIKGELTAGGKVCALCTGTK